MSTPVIVRQELKLDRSVVRFVPASLLSLVFHVALLGAFLLLAPPVRQDSISSATTPVEVVGADAVEDVKKVDFLIVDVDPWGKENDTDINYPVDRRSEISVPGQLRPDDSVGTADGDKNALPTSVPPTSGFGDLGNGAALTISGVGNSATSGDPGANRHGLLVPGSIFGRSSGSREWSLRNGGGTSDSEAAVSRGLRWLQRVQSPDGKWMIDGPFKDNGTPNDIAGTALGLLPFLAAGKTHRAEPNDNNLFSRTIEKGLAFLVRRQDKRTGEFGGGMYAHALASIAMSEAYGLTQDPNLRRPAQMGLNFIVAAQHDAGGWRYTPNQSGDLSVSGWQIMALKSGIIAGFDVPEAALRKAGRFLDACCDSNDGYGYVGPNATPPMTAVGLLCRQYLQGWGPQNLRMQKGVDILMSNPPTMHRNNVYYTYYATQVLHHFGGQAWKTWNDQMRDMLVKSQDADPRSPTFGSWTSESDVYRKEGGRLMTTSMNLLTLEVYYRYLPLYYRDAGAVRDAMGKQ